jgi:hypothetical protein
MYQDAPVTIGYLGVKPPPLEVPLIELETEDGAIVDLYNDCSLSAVVFDRAGLTFLFARFDAGGVRVAFEGVRELRVEQPHDWVPEEATQIDHLLIRRKGPWPQVLFKAGGLSDEFQAARLCLVT